MIKKEHKFNGNGDRYHFDFKICSVANGYAQIDTKQDAWYYGNWCNPTDRVLVSYCEGDITVTRCDTDDEFKQEVESMAKWSTEAGYGFNIDGMCNDRLIEQFEALGLEKYLH